VANKKEKRMTELRIETNLDFETERLAKEAIDACFVVHKEMGPGLLEKVYEACLCQELRDRNIPFEVQKSIPLFFKGKKLDIDHRLDLIIDGKIIIEIKAVDREMDIHRAQLLSYLKLSGIRLGLLVNFNATLMKDGIKRVVL
jgi:GxxExxY protein